LDSSFLIDHLMGQMPAVERWTRLFADGDQPFINEIVICEVRTGLRPEEEIHLRTLVEPVEFVQPGPEAALLAGRWRHDLARKGFTLSLADALIAATASSLDAAILTRNVRHFELTPVPIETY
jgi:predicted nucleic acid-binding protein